MAVGEEEEGATPMWALILSRLLRRSSNDYDRVPSKSSNTLEASLFFPWVSSVTAALGRQGDCFTDYALAHWVGPWVKGVVAWVSEGVGDEEVRSKDRAN